MTAYLTKIKIEMQKEGKKETKARHSSTYCILNYILFARCRLTQPRCGVDPSVVGLNNYSPADRADTVV